MDEYKYIFYCLLLCIETILRPVLKNKKTVSVPEEKHFKESQVWACEINF